MFLRLLISFLLLQIQIYSFSQSNVIISDFNSRPLSRTANGNTIFAGSSSGLPSIIKLDPNNNLVWSRELSSSGQFLSIVAKNESIYLTNFSQNDFRILKMDVIGNLVWSKSYNQSSVGPLNFPLKLYNDSLFSAYIDATELKIFCLDTFGNVLWNKTISVTNESFPISDIWKFRNDVYVSFNAAGHYNLVKFSNSGNLLWHKTYSNNLVNLNYSANTVIHNDGTFTLTGTANVNGTSFLKIDTLGNVIDYKFFDYGASNHLGKSIYYNGKYYLGGFRGDPLSTVQKLRYYISEFDSVFNPLRQIHFDYITTSPLFHLDLIHDGNGFNMVNFIGPDAIFFRFSDLNQITCDTTHFSIDSIPISTFAISNNFSSNLGVTLVADSPIFQNSSVILYPGCQINGVENNATGNEKYSIYPNPNNGQFTLNYNLREGENGSFKIYNAIGQLVYHGNLKQNNGSHNFDLDLSSGVYVWAVESGNAILKNEKFTIIK